jgi:hypothetical protein
VAAERERLADDREHDALAREQRIDRRHRRRTGQPATGAGLPARQEQARLADLRAEGEQRREDAAARRRAAAADHARAVATWAPQAHGPMLVASFAQLAHELFASTELAELLPRVLQFTVKALPGCDHASVTLCRQGKVVDTFSTDEIAAELDDLQFASAGAAPEALRGDDPVYAPRLAQSSGWPALAAAARRLGVASVLSCGLFVRQPGRWSELGVLSLYGGAPDAFSPADQEFASVLASYVSVAVAIVQRRDEMDRHEAALHRD